jgi:hypothetical protein
MEIEISSFNGIHDWCAGEIHHYILMKFVEKYPNIKFNIFNNNNFAKKYDLPSVEKNSIANMYNLIIHNPSNNKMFINSLNDYAPCCLLPGTGVDKFNIVGFGCVSNHTEHNAIHFAKYNLLPSFYILEKTSDIQRIERFKNKPRIYNSAYFLGLIHSKRSFYVQAFKDCELIKIFDKSLYWKDRDDYFEELTNYKMSFSMDGAAIICHRDIESIGVGNILVRENIDIKMFEPLIPNVHYIEILTKEEKGGNIFNFKEIILDRINSFVSDKVKTNDMLNESHKWFLNNCLPDKQFEIVNKLTKNLEILI